MKLLSPRVRLRLFGLITKHGIRVINSEPGRIVVSIATWREYENEILQLIAELRTDPYVYDIQFKRGIAEVVYDQEALSDSIAINRWLQTLDKYAF